MDKKDAIELFGGRARYLATALKKSEPAICRWPEKLDEDRTNLVIGAAVRKGIIKGCRLPECVRREVENAQQK